MRGLERLTRWLGHSPEQLPTMDAYARWAPEYPPTPHNPLMEAEAAMVGSLLRTVAPRRALDVGTGTGRNLHLLRAAGAAFVAGIDLSSSMLRHGSGAFPRVLGDATRLPFRNASFDLVSSSLMCGDVEDLRGWIGEATRVLRLNGHLIYSDFHPAWTEEGWRRTFSSSDGHTYELPLYPHAIEDHVALLDACGMSVRAIREPRVPGRRKPVVVVLHAVRDTGRGL